MIVTGVLYWNSTISTCIRYLGGTHVRTNLLYGINLFYLFTNPVPPMAGNVGYIVRIPGVCLISEHVEWVVLSFSLSPCAFMVLPGFRRGGNRRYLWSNVPGTVCNSQVPIADLVLIV